MLVNFARSGYITSLVLIFCFAHPSQAQIIGLGDFPGGDSRSSARGVSSDGSVVIGNGFGTDGEEAFRWTQSGGLESLGNFSATDISADGLVVVGNGFRTNGLEAVRWTSSGGLQGLGDLPGGAFSSRATGVSADGSVVVGRGDIANGFEAFRWTSSGGIQNLQDLPRLPNLMGNDIVPDGNIANDVSADGSVVVGVTRGSEAFRWISSDGVIRSLGSLPGGRFSSSRAFGVSADGSVVVGDSNNEVEGSQAFRWTSGGGMQGLGNLPGGFSSAGRDVSADGSVVIGSCIIVPEGGYTFEPFNGENRGLHAYIWVDGIGMRSLFDVLAEQGADLSNWTSLNNADAISADGRTIVGTGTNVLENNEAFVATLNLVPQPVLLGDVNVDGVVDFSDITPFILAQLSGVFQEQADCDLSGDITFDDIPPFIVILNSN